MNLAVLVKLNFSLVNQLGKNLNCGIAVIGLLLHLIELLLEFIKLGKLLINGPLADCLFRLLICNLPLRPSPLDAGLEHVVAIAFGGYNPNRRTLEN